MEPVIGLPARLGASVSQMRSGIVLLTVPLLDDVIQVGTAGTPATGTIEVAKTNSTMVVCRTDGRPLQAQILHQREKSSALRLPVFGEPVRSLRLRRVQQPDGSGLWIVMPGRRIRRYRDFYQLVETITTFGLAKQLRTHSVSGVADR